MDSIWNQYEDYQAWIHYEEYCATWNYFEEDPDPWTYYDEPQFPAPQLSIEVPAGSMEKSYSVARAGVKVDTSPPPLMSPPPQASGVGVPEDKEKLQVSAKAIPVAALPRHTLYGLLSAPPTQLLHYELALSHVSPPIEDSERCHICDRLARSLRNHIAWCRNCSSALLDHLEFKSMGEYPRRELPPHAWEHANRWYRFCIRMKRSRMWFRWEKRVTFGRTEKYYHSVPSENRMRPTRATPTVVRNRLEGLHGRYRTQSSSGSASSSSGMKYQ